jgi:hypothetical protein
VSCGMAAFQQFQVPPRPVSCTCTCFNSVTDPRTTCLWLSLQYECGPVTVPWRQWVCDCPATRRGPFQPRPTHSCGA